MDNSLPKASIDFFKSANTQSGEALKILVIDDTESDRVSYRRYLQSDAERSYHIIEAETLEEGLELCRSQQPEIVLLDINLPDGDGLEFLEAIENERLINKLPVIMMTGQGDERVAVRAMKLGAADYLVKSDVTAISLLTCINQVQENNLLIQQLRRSQQQQTIIASMALHIRRSLTFDSVCNAIVQEIRNFLAADRTIIYRFEPDMSGKIVAEDVISPWKSCLDIQIEDTCFQENLGGEYQKGKVFAAHDIYEANLTECHIRLLERFQIRANLVVPILLNGHNTLWGLLIVQQCSSTRYWQEEDIQLLHQLSIHLAIALQQAELYQNLENLNSSLEEKVQERTEEIQLQAQMLEQIHDAVISTTPDGTILTWNTGAERLYEYKASEAIGQNISILYLSEDLPFMQSKVFIPVIEKGIHELEQQNRTKSGNIIDISLRLSVVRDSMGNPIRLIGCSNNISDRKRAEQALQQLNQQLEDKVEERTIELQQTSERLALALKSGAFGCWEWNLVQNIKFWDERMYELYGMPKQDDGSISYEDWSDKLHPEDRDSIKRLLQQAILGEVEYDTEFRILHPNGNIHFIKAYGVLVRDLEGKPKRMIGINYDISDRKRIESALRESEAKFRRLVEGANDVIWSTDRNGIFDYLSPQFQNLFGFSPHEWIGKSFVRLIHPEDFEWLKREYIDHVQSGNKVSNIEFRHLHQDDYYIWVSVNATPILNAEGLVIGSQGILTDISDRKKAEQEILENHRLIQQIADSSPNVLYLYDIQEQRNTYANREILAVLGYSAAEIQAVGAAWLPMIIHPDDIKPVLEHFEKLKQAKDGEIFSNEYRFRHANGEWRYFYSRDLIFSRDVEGKVKLIIGTAQDITDRKNTEAALRASDQRWQFALEGAGDGIWDWDVATNKVFFSQQWKAMLGYTDDEIENKFESWASLVHPDDIAQCYADIDKCISNQTPLYENEHRLRCKDGSYKWILARGKVFEWDANGQALRMMGTHTDLSDRKRAALELQQLTERLTLALKSGAIGCWDWNINDNSLYWDDRMYEIYGIPKQSNQRLIYDTWINAVHPDDLTTTKALVEQSAFGISDFDAEFRIVLPNSEIRFVKAYAVAIKDSLDNIQGMIGINFDISDRKQAEAQLQQINDELRRATKLKDEFLANMSHELRTPLNAILGMSEALLEQVLGSLNARQQKAIGNIERSGKHLLELINDILDLSKIASGKMKLNLTSASIDNLCSSSEVFVRQQAFQKNIQIISKIPPNLSDITVDERRIKQVLINLLTNAVKFTPNHGRITFSVAVGHRNTWLGEAQIPHQIRSEDSPMLLFQVTDTGIGIAPEDLSKLFQPFVQVDSNLNRQYEGTGLGLAMVKQIVEMHHGKVVVESKIGHGSSFTVALPYAIAIPTNLESTPETAAPPDLATRATNKVSPLILLTEDNVANIDSFSMYFTALEYRVILAKNGQEAIDLAKSANPDIILMDIQMPVMDGLEATRLIRQDPQIAHIPIIALTALAMQNDEALCLDAGANAYMAKPIRLKQLNNKIQEILSRKSL